MASLCLDLRRLGYLLQLGKCHLLTLAKKKILFVSCNGPKKYSVGKWVIFALFFWAKMCVLCMFYVDWELGGLKQLKGRDFFE